MMLLIDRKDRSGSADQIAASDRVVLTEDMPELMLHRGAVGVVRSTWFYPDVAYEVEFESGSSDCPTRVLLVHGQIEAQE